MSPARARIASRELAERAATGEIAAIARLISRAEAGLPEAQLAIAKLRTGCVRPHVIGVTGVPGSGKSSLVARLARLRRASGARVAIVAVDPSSPISGGAILGDRIRMGELQGDDGVFVRSMATRGALGGLARATLDAVDILGAGGFGTVFIETVGVGQDEVDIARACHTTLVVSAPGLGDEVQAIKAGILEIADIHVVSKCDRGDAARTLADLKAMLTLGIRGTATGAWRAPVIGTSVQSGEGLEALAAALDGHRDMLARTGQLAAREHAIAAYRLAKTAEALLQQRLTAALPARLDALAARLAGGEGDVYALARQLVEDVISADTEAVP
ncbi:MAG: methylmalonyl Co-A mutase-associated GTPase MeaB [Alphaproteobacteria bacterium]|nr:methylmalonyl Co-A mutase-associated GTPase MeaB [Alphaproteobacteria bacterium]